MISYLENHILRPRTRRVRGLGAAIASVLAATLLATAGSSQGSIRVERALDKVPVRALALVNGNLIDGNGTKPVKNAVVLIKGQRIVFAGPRRKVAIPARARRIDVHGATILPGFINTHVHVGYSSENLRAWLLGGVTTVRDLGSGPNYEWVFGLRNELNRSSSTARLLAVGPLITVPDGYPEAIWGNPGLEVTSVDDARAKTERLVLAGCDTVKIALESGAIFGRELPMLSLDEVKAIVEVAHAHGKRVAAHAMVTKDIELAIDGGVDEIAHYDVEDIPQSLIERMVATRMDWIPTLELLHVVRATIYGDSLKRYVRAGGIVALGTDYMGAGPEYGYDLGMPIHELIYMDQLGMTPMQVIVAATKNAAYAVGHPELGVIGKGKIADVIAVKGDPLKDLNVMTRIKLVVHNGTVVLKKLG